MSRLTPGGPSTPDPRVPRQSLRLHHWSDPAIIAVGLIALASGFGQFSVVSALGDVSSQLGHTAPGATIADKIGLSGTSLGAGLAVIRAASLASLPLIGWADRRGRRPVILRVTAIGLLLTILAAASPGYWWFVVVFAFGRPLLSATNALAEVMGAEETGARDRAAAVALVTAGYAVGAGASAVLHSLAAGALGFRGLFALAVVPLGLVAVVARRVEEPSRFTVAEVAATRPTPVLGAVGPRFRRRVVTLCLIAFALSVITGPANSFVFLFAQDVVHQPGYQTASMVIVAGAAGLGGLLAGRWAADRVGRRPTAAVAMVAIAASSTLLYSGTRAALLVGYVLAVLCGGVIAPAVGSLLVELFPTPVRASATGWWVAAGVVGAVVGLVVFGEVADVGERFAVAADIVFLPTAAAGGLFWLLPETKGHEPEELWSEPS